VLLRSLKPYRSDMDHLMWVAQGDRKVSSWHTGGSRLSGTVSRRTCALQSLQGNIGPKLVKVYSKDKAPTGNLLIDIVAWSLLCRSWSRQVAMHPMCRTDVEGRAQQAAARLLRDIAQSISDQEDVDLARIRIRPVDFGSPDDHRATA
jgi:hypothetical protein